MYSTISFIVQTSYWNHHHTRRRPNKMDQVGGNHIWNTLLLGPNIVVDTMSQFSTSESTILKLDGESRHWSTFTVALGETQLQLVKET